MANAQLIRSDALGHVLNMIGRDWTHLGVAKLYSDIVANGYHIMYLTSRSVGQANTTRNYLNSVVQDSYRLPKGPVILSPDRTIAALRREVYLRKPEVFKMACLRDIYNLFGQNTNPFYAGFGNRLTDALSYRSVNIPSTRIFTINSHAEVSLDMLSLSKYKSSYVTMRELVDHFFPPIGLLIPSGGENYTDFNYWRETPLDLSDFSASDTDDDGDDDGQESVRSEDEGSIGLEDEEIGDRMESSYLSQPSMDDSHELGRLSLEDSVTDDLEQIAGTVQDEPIGPGLEFHSTDTRNDYFSRPGQNRGVDRDEGDGEEIEALSEGISRVSTSLPGVANKAAAVGLRTLKSVESLKGQVLPGHDR